MNQIATEFGLPTFNDNYVPHISIAWFPFTDRDLNTIQQEQLNENNNGTGLFKPIIIPKDLKTKFQKKYNLGMTCSGIKISMGKTATSLIDFPKE